MANYEENDRFEKFAAAIQTEVRDERVKRAEKYAEYMRNWLALLTIVVTLAFIVFGAIGVRSFSELENFRNQMKANAEAASTQKKEIDAAAQSAQSQLAGIQARVQSLQSDLDTFESRFGGAKARADLATTDPIILKGPQTPVGWMSIEGKNFGKSQGHLYSNVQLGSYPSGVVEIEPSSIRRWSNTDISFVLSDADTSALSKALGELQPRVSQLSGLGATIGSSLGNFQALASAMTFQVVTSSGKPSTWTSPINWPTGQR